MENGSLDYADDFFGKPAFLTVSGQLQGEYYACGMSNIYTFGPTFRAEISHTTRHLAEFWMIEPEMAFCTLEDDMQCAEDYVRFCCDYMLKNCVADLEFICKFIDSEAKDRLTKVATTNFKRVTYTECIEILEDAVKTKKKKFKEKVGCSCMSACLQAAEVTCRWNGDVTCKANTSAILQKRSSRCQ